MIVDQFTSAHAPTETDEQFQTENSYTLDVADQGKKVQTLDPDAGESVSLNGDDVPRVRVARGLRDRCHRRPLGYRLGDPTNVYLTGPGTVALSTHGDPLVLTPPVNTDTDAIVAWSAELSPSVATNKTIEVG